MCPFRIKLADEGWKQKNAQGTYQRELELCSWLASKSMPLAANEAYSSTIKSYLQILQPYRLAADGFQGWRLVEVIKQHFCSNCL